MENNPDIIIIGSGGGGAVAAKELGELGLNVLVLDAGPWYGNKKWPEPNKRRGDQESDTTYDLDVSLYREQLTRREQDMNDPVTGKFRWGAADRRRSPWFRNIPDQGLVWQNAGIGGTTLHYFANSPRPYPHAIDREWPISYKELIPYFEKVERTLPVQFAPTTAKEELFYYGAEKTGFSLLGNLDVTRPGYRPQPNAILPPNKALSSENYTLEEVSHMEGCTLSGHCEQGCPYGPSVDKTAKRSTNVSYIPLALKTGKVRIRPNTFATKILTEKDKSGEHHAVGVQVRDTWTGEVEELKAGVVVMAAGCIESPRLWMNSHLPHNPWVGRGLTNHYMDAVTGTFEEEVLLDILGSSEVNPFVGHTSGARLDYPGLGMIENMGNSPGLTAQFLHGFSQTGYSSLQDSNNSNDLWDSQGRTVGNKLKKAMSEYQRSLTMLIVTDDEVQYRNRVELDPFIKDEHGPVPRISYTPSKRDEEKRNKLAKVAAEMLKYAGAKEIIRSDLPPNLFIHLESTMRMGYVVDSSCETFQVKRLFIADNSVHYNSIGGPNPTMTTQALATRTAELIAKKYF
ncbi:GMC family oxidoreductase N-terminal domain-containing protein [Bacillus sp. FJAT-44742]|uniref:GMC family oxidoreductase N-terminal domain-containing protein n=1 Tax=Bacillus sp. FJAT-44742 TaxID=2014005 RepID=UPI000C2429B0|nr:GMC family oxidoreductase [Bacillus sp. FJAT-44742]